MSVRLVIASIAVLVGVSNAGLPAVPQAAWPGFRGPAMNGLAPDASLPTEWSVAKNVAWVADVPGQGWSSPIVVGNTVIVTSAVSARPFKKPTPGIYGNDYIAELRAQGLSTPEINARVRARDNEIPEESGPIRYMVMAFDAGTGKKKWERLAHEGIPAGGRHRKNTYASETPVSDGARVFVSFGQNVGVFAYTLDGDPLWKRVWPPQPIYLDFGTGSSPVHHDGRLYLLQDSERECFLTALDARTGEDVWRTPRPDKSSFRRTSSWSTPLLWKNSIRTEIVTTGHGFIWSYDLNGKELWRVGNTFMPLASPLAVADVLYVGTGAQEGDAARPFFAIRAGASGAITLAEQAVSNDFILWMHPRASGYTPSALVHRNRVYLVHDLGTMLVLAADTGKEIYRARVGGVGHTFSASPIASGNYIYFPDEDGTTVVIEAGDVYKEVGQSALDEMMLASPAVAGQGLFLRTERKLYRISSSAWVPRPSHSRLKPSASYVRLFTPQDPARRRQS